MERWPLPTIQAMGPSATATFITSAPASGCGKAGQTMNIKQLVLLIGLLGVAAGVAVTRYGHYREKSKLSDPLGTRLTIDYTGTVEGLFQKLSEKSGVQYKLDPGVQKRPVHCSLKEASIV